MSLKVILFMPFLGGGYLSSASGSGTQMPSLAIGAGGRGGGVEADGCLAATELVVVLAALGCCGSFFGARAATTP